MDWLVIEGVRPYDGRYEFDPIEQPFTVREWGWIKRFAGYLPAQLDDVGSDPELATVFAIIALHRAGKITQGDVADVYDRFQDTPFVGAIRMEITAREEDDLEDPPASSDASPSSNGSDSPTSSENWVSRRVLNGIPASATSASHPTGSPT